ncbi:antitoxin [Paludisphaera borealis]
MLAVPPRLLELLGLRAGATVGVVFDGRRLVIEPNPRPRYTLDELLAQCDPSAEPIAGDRAWLDDEAVGSELL